MWRSTQLARKAACIRGAPKFRAIQNPDSQVLQCHQSLLLPDLASLQHCCYSFSHFTSWASLKLPFYQSTRLLSSNPYLENEDFQPEKPVSDSRNGFNENPRFSFDSAPNTANEEFGDNFSSVESRFDFDENPVDILSEFAEGREKIDDLAVNFEGFGAGNDDEEKGVLEDGDDNVDKTEKKEEMTEEWEDFFSKLPRINIHRYSSGNDDEEKGVLEGGDDNVDKTEKMEEMVEKLEDLLSLLQSSGDIKSLESSLQDLGLALNEEFVVRVLETLFVPGENLIGFFKWVLKDSEFLVTKRVIDALVRAINREVRTRDAYALWDLLKETGAKEVGVLSTETLNELLSLFSKLGKGKVAFEVFNKFEEFGCVPNADTYYFTIDTLCRRMIFDWACSVCERMLNADKLPDSEKVGKIVSHLCKGKKLKDAHAVYLWAKKGKNYPPQSCVNLLIGSLCEKGKLKGQNTKRETDTYSQGEDIVSEEEKENVYLALKMLDDFSGEDHKQAIKPFSFVTQGLCRIKDFEGVKKLLFQMIEAGPPPGYAIFNTIITGLSKAGEMEEAMKMLKMMEDRGLKPDVYTYTVIMSGYVEGGAMEEACKILDEAKKKHSKLSPATYHTLIRGFCKLEQFDKAINLMGEMKDYGVQPNADEYNKLIRSLCMKALDWKTSEKLLEEMRGNRLHLNEKLKSLVRAVKELEEEGVGRQDVPAAV